MNLSPYSNVDRIVVGSGPKGKVERPKHKADQVRNKKKTQKSSSKPRGSPYKSLVKKRRIFTHRISWPGALYPAKVKLISKA